VFSLRPINDETPIQIPIPSWEHREFASSTGKRLVYTEPREFAMGATAWKIEVFQEGKNITHSLSAISEAAKDGGFLLPPNFQPWSPTGDLLSIPTWKAHHFLYDISQNSIVRSEIEGLIDALIWSPSENKYLVVAFCWAPVRSRSYFLADNSGLPKCQIDVMSLLDEPAQCWWLKDGSVFIILYRNSKQAHPFVEFFDSASGRSIERIPVNPSQLIPWHESEFRDISRDHYTLEISPSTRCVGSLLDTWHSCYFDNTTNRFSLAVYRPKDGKIVQKNEVVVPVKELRCQLQLEF
jgi:hypothetical protein